MPLDEMEEYPSMEESSQAMGMGLRGMKGQQMQTSQSAAAQQALKERKKSLMTRFIPGRGAAGGGMRFSRTLKKGLNNRREFDNRYCVKLHFISLSELSSKNNFLRSLFIFVYNSQNSNFIFF